MDTLHIDIETYSPTDLTTSGVYRYSEDPGFLVLMAAWSFNKGPVQVAIGEREVRKIPGFGDSWVRHIAHNAPFERVCLSRLQGFPTGDYWSPLDWHDTQAVAGELGYPQKLSELARALGGEQKDEAGTRLINLFCKPNRHGKRNLPEDFPDEWAQFVEYCRQDVVTLISVDEKLGDFPTETERRVWEADQRINDLGIDVDLELARAAVLAAEDNRMAQEVEISRLTGISNPGSGPQMLAWLKSSGLAVSNLQAATIETLLQGTLTPVQRTVLELRQELALVAAKKYQAALNATSEDGRLRGSFRFFGAHTGRWSGSGVQLHNLPKAAITKPDPATGKERWDRWGEAASILDLKMGLGADAHTLKALVRPLFTGPFTVVDYSSIEARVIAWLAGEQWALDAFTARRDIYVETAKRMSTPGNELTRAQGKVAVLALGYNGGVGSLRTMGAEGTDEALQMLVDQWRRANPAIVELWRTMGDAFRLGGDVGEHVSVERDGKDRLVRLPSGRAIVYHGVQWEWVDTTYGGRRQQASFIDPKKRGLRVRTYGGRLIENCLAGDTEVLTNRGWVHLREVQTSDLVWDGVDWVRHEGLVAKGSQKTLSVDGVHMTPDHRVLTKTGWVRAASSTGFERLPVFLPDGYSTGGEHSGRESSMGGLVRLWSNKDDGGLRTAPREAEIMRVSERTDDRGVEYDSRDESSSCLRGMAFDERPVQAPFSPGVEELWRARDKGLRSMGEVIRSLLGGHGADVPSGVGHRQGRQLRRVFPGELSVGYPGSEQPEPTKLEVHRHPRWKDDRVRGLWSIWDRGHDAAVPAESQRLGGSAALPSGSEEQVYDLLNSGPRSRFVVRGQTGPLIVHNCTQAVARDVLAEALLDLHRCGYDVVGHVHDEVLIEGVGTGSVTAVSASMTHRLPWAAGLPISATGFTCDRYRKG